MMGGIPPPPKNSLARIFTPPRKRRRVRQSAISLIPAFDFHSRSLLPFPPPLHSRPLSIPAPSYIPASSFHSCPLFIPAPSFHSCPLFHSCVGRNLCGEAAFADRRQLQCSASRKILAVARMRFRLSPEWKIFFTPRLFFTLRRLRGGCEREAVAGGGERAMMGGIPPPPKNSLARIFTPPRKRRRVRQSAISLIPAFDFHSRSLFIPALFPFLPPLPFLRRQESLRRSRIRRQATIAMFRFAENSRCCENEIPAFAGMEDIFYSTPIFYPPPLAGGGASAKRSRGVASGR